MRKRRTILISLRAFTLYLHGSKANSKTPELLPHGLARSCTISRLHTFPAFTAVLVLIFAQRYAMESRPFARLKSGHRYLFPARKMKFIRIDNSLETENARTG